MTQVSKSHGVAVLAGALVALAIAALLKESWRPQPLPTAPPPAQGRLVPLVGRPARAVTVAEGLEAPYGLAFRHGDLYVGETGRIVRFRYDAKSHATRDPVVVAELPA